MFFFSRDVSTKNNTYFHRHQILFHVFKKLILLFDLCCVLHRLIESIMCRLCCRIEFGKTKQKQKSNFKSYKMNHHRIILLRKISRYSILSFVTVKSSQQTRRSFLYSIVSMLILRYSEDYVRILTEMKLIQ